MTRFVDDFSDGLNPAWDVTQMSGSTVTAGGGELRLANLPTRERYTNAQIADYTYADYKFRWRPPTRMTVVARASAPAHDLRGTAGFGFWNHPFSPDARRLPRLPQAIWFFFSSPPSNMALAHGVPGPGWKAATIDAARRSALAVAPLGLPAMLLMQSRRLYDRMWPALQRRLAISETLLDGALLAETHTYTIDWRTNGATFAVDGATVLEASVSPRGPCGFVAWIDNQYAIVTPRGRFGFGLVPVEREQALLLERVEIESGEI
jgi:hypothetical protein